MDFHRLLADAIVAVHLVYVAFVVLGMAAILIGIARRWSWVRNFWFRTIHLLMIGVVVVESQCGVLCPLTEWEDRLREASGHSSEAGSFVGRWAHELLFVDVPLWVMSICYAVFGLAVLATYLLARPRWPWGRQE
jgi:hypothetical protein